MPAQLLRLYADIEHNILGQMVAPFSVIDL